MLVEHTCAKLVFYILYLTYGEVTFLTKLLSKGA
jgi:hypothetical protein